MIKIRTPEGVSFDKGIDTIIEIVKKRADMSLFDDDALIYLIQKTGGVLRDLFRCINSAADRADTRGSDKIELEDSLSAAKQLSSSLTRRIESSNYPLLSDIYQGSKYKHLIADRKMLLEMMQGLIVLEYNGDRWHDLHPLIEDYLIEQEALRQKDQDELS
jgi:hypothetical protein